MEGGKEPQRDTPPHKTKSVSADGFAPAGATTPKTQERIFTMNENYILSNDELFDLSESAPLTEGGTLDELLDEAKEVMRAIDEAKADDGVLVDNRAWALYLMRGFYFLGILRGGEAYRATLLDDIPGADEPPIVPFALSESCTDLFVKDLAEEPSETLEAIYKALGL